MCVYLFMFLKNTRLCCGGVWTRVKQSFDSRHDLNHRSKFKSRKHVLEEAEGGKLPVRSLANDPGMQKRDNNGVEGK